jgi:hypothetical protein
MINQLMLEAVMYSMRHGILYHNEEPVICMGQTYSGSYHEKKVPVPPGGDTIGEMKKDLRRIKEAGFNLVRTAALGNIDWNGGDVKASFPTRDIFCTESDDLDMAVMMRLQGYSMNLRNFEDATMVDHNGVPMFFYAGWFLRNCMNHPGIIEDNNLGTTAAAAHFKNFKNVVAFQIYNEPAYPTKGFYDYHPHSVSAYRWWLVKKGYATEAEAAKIEPPCARPDAGADPVPWIRFRTFCMERMSDFLVQMGERAREGHSVPELATDQMPCPVMPGSAIRGEDYYDLAKGMDFIGITHYIPCRGPSYHTACLALDAAESAAAVYGKHAWLLEYNARTNMPPEEWDRETYAALGRGYKGIIYYQWRADYPYPDGPEPDEFGMLFNDGRKAPCYDAGVALVGLVNKLSAWLVRAEKERDGVAILYSHYANAYFDAIDNGSIEETADAHDRYSLAMRHCYHALNALGVVTDFVRAEDLKTGKYPVKVLIIPILQGLSEEERSRVEEFIKTGGKVFCYEDAETAFLPYDKSAPVMHGILREQYDVNGLLSVLNYTPHVQVTGAPSCDARLLTGVKDGKAFGIICLANYDTLERAVEGAVLRMKKSGYKKATAFASGFGDGKPLVIDGSEIQLPRITTGAFVLLEE